ncbi:hypothetical protein [Rhizobium leguminosarum]|uniref:hypothetical protein n=1 Tax=Rhizobium leguminosarum TaxID=384 RepID=UPI003F9D8892
MVTLWSPFFWSIAQPAPRRVFSFGRSALAKIQARFLKKESFAGSISEAKHSHKNRNQTGVYEPATNRIIADF